MIKSNLPVPFLYRLRSRDRALRPSLYNPGGAASPMDTGCLCRMRGRSAGRRTARPRTTERFIKDFIREYERFTGVLCAAAMSGCGSRCEHEYVRARRWFIGHYYRIAPRLRPYLVELYGADDLLSGDRVLIRDYAGQPRAVDALEELFLPQTLKDLLDKDNGWLLPRLAQLSEAIYRCMDDIEKD